MVQLPILDPFCKFFFEVFPQIFLSIFLYPSKFPEKIDLPVAIRSSLEYPAKFFQDLLPAYRFFCKFSFQFLFSKAWEILEPFGKARDFKMFESFRATRKIIPERRVTRLKISEMFDRAALLSGVFFRVIYLSLAVCAAARQRI